MLTTPKTHAHRARAAAQSVTAALGGPEVAQLLLVAASALVAFHLSLLTLSRAATGTDPASLIALAPACALAVAVARARPRPGEPAIHDRQLDWLVGLPLVATAVAAGFWWPAWGSPAFWSSRLDLLVLPLFAAGAVALLAGTRVLWRVRAALVLLLLAGAAPVRDLLSGLTRVCGVAVGGLLPMGAATVAPDGAVLVVVPGGQQLVLAAGATVVTGALGFALVTGLLLLTVRGKTLRKLGWLGAGLLLSGGLAASGIVLVVIAARSGMSSAAVAGRFIGVASCAAALAVMLSGLRWFGLRPLGPGSPSRAEPSPVHRPRALAVVAIAAVLLAVANRELAPAAARSEPLGATRLLSLLATGGPVTPSGWRLEATRPQPLAADPYGHIEDYLGTGATWSRHRYRDAEGDTRAVTLDILASPRFGALDSLPVERVYTLLGAPPRGREAVDLGPLTGTTETFADAASVTTWTTVHWTSRVRTAAGEREERATLTAALPLDASDAELRAERARLTELGGQLVAAQLRSSGLDADHQADPREER